MYYIQKFKGRHLYYLLGAKDKLHQLIDKLISHKVELKKTFEIY